MVIQEPLLYGEINGLCILILLILLMRTHTNEDQQYEQQLFVRLLAFSAAFCLADLLWLFADQKILEIPRIVNAILNVIYYALAGQVSFVWFMYSEQVQKAPTVSTAVRRHLCRIPVLILIVLAVASIWTGWFFHVDEQGDYHRGPLYWLDLAIPYGYLAVTTGRAVQAVFKNRNYLERAKNLMLASFAVPPAIFGIAQALFPGVPMFCVGMTIAILIFYLEMRERLISLDPLTKLNNRRQLLIYLSERIAPKNIRPMYLMMMDVDKFKEINDTYGHLEGDNALVRVSKVLHGYVDAYEKRCFAARYGGDEFVLICETDDLEWIRTSCEQIQQTIDAVNSAVNSRYDLKLSIGCIRYREGMSLQEFLRMADEALYQAKREGQTMRIR